ncbi:TonB-dependent receptor [Sandarakinorhabdus sp.]|uniref:TonB-dependent receptor n=1 Tax=Sandarakinorhabdus sp. TaxID=1916663 RepID=UPI003F6E5457
MSNFVAAKKAALLLGLSAFAAPAFAQTASANAPVAATADDEMAQEDDVIIVTASKRTATLQDTPISVAVTTGAALQQAQVRDLIDIQTLVPSLRVTQLQSSANTNFIIRGFGNGANNPGIEPSVGVFIDGVYRSRSAAQIGDLPNLERVEVLRGPQSTLFGKNASAGIISVVTAAPKFKWGGSAEATYGNYNAFILKADITGPISETLAFSLAGNINKRDGFAYDPGLDLDFNDRNRWGVRGQLLWQASDRLSFRLIGDYDKIDENCCIAANLTDGPTGNAVRAVGGRIDSQNPFSFVTFNNFASTNDIENYGVSLQTDWDANDSLKVTMINAWRRVDSFTNQDSDFTSADLIGSNDANTKIDTYTSELRLASNFDGFFNFLVGAFYFNEDIDFSNNLTYGRDFRNYANLLTGGGYTSLEPALGLPAGTFGGQGQGLFERYTLSNRAISLFGTLDFAVTDRFTLTAGFNYTDDRKRVTTNVRSTDVFSGLDLVAIGTAIGVPPQFAANPAVNPLLALQPLQFLPPFLNFPNAVEPGRTNDRDLAYTLRAAWRATDQLSLYATHATGFKASSFNLSRDSRPFRSDFIPGSPVTNPPASPIRTAGLAVANLTTGTRFAQPEHATVYEVGVKVDVEGFSMNVAGFYQFLNGFQQNIFTGTGFQLGNAEKQSTWGVEVDSVLRPTRNLSLGINLTLLDPTYDSFTQSAFGDLSGTRPAGIPTVTLTLAPSWRINLGNENRLLLRADYQHQSNTQVVDGFPQFRREQNLLNAAATLQFRQGIEVSVWGRNLTNDQFLLSAFPSVAQNGSFSGYPNAPRTYGGTVRYRF